MDLSARRELYRSRPGRDFIDSGGRSNRVIARAQPTIWTPVNLPTGNIMIPMTASGPQGPTGQVNNSNTSSFPVGNGGDGGSAHFIFANLNGTISAWDTSVLLLATLAFCDGGGRR